MSLDGLRAWIGEVERKLGMRTRVFLVLVAIAVGGAGAGIYLAIKAADDSVSKSEVQAVREGLETQLGSAGATGTADVAGLEAELSALRAEVEALKGQGETSGAGKGDVPSQESSGNSSGKSSGGASSSHSDGGASAGTGSAEAGKPKELVEKTKEHAK
jgi:hypothetical protein